MTGRSKTVIALILVASLAIVAPPLFRTINMASSADGLLFLSYLSDEDFSLNPWADSCFLIIDSNGMRSYTSFLSRFHSR